MNQALVKVRGLYRATDEGLWLVGPCNTHLTTKALKWSNILALYVDMSDEKMRLQWSKALETIHRAKADSEKHQIWLTLYGRLETRASMDEEVVQMPYGLAKAGFGHLGAAPAELNVLSVENIEFDPSTDGVSHTP